MSGTHTHAGLPGRAGERRRGAVRPSLVLLAALICMFSLMSMGAQPAGTQTARWSAVEFSASGSEMLTGVGFWTPADNLHYTLGIYRQLQNGVPQGLLIQQTGKTGTRGFYCVGLKGSLSMASGDGYVVVLGLQGSNPMDLSNVAAESLTPASSDKPQRFLSSADGACYAPALSDPFSIHVRTTPEAAQVPEAVAIQQFVVTTPPVVAGVAMTFSVSATGTTPGDALNYQIDYGDGSVPPAAVALCTVSPVVNCVTAPYTYAKAGNYTATLTVTDTVDSTTATVTLNIAVQILVTVATDNATPPCGVVPLNVCFLGSADLGTPPYAYDWNFGDGTADTHDVDACHAFLNVGTYTVTLTVTDSIGATGSATLIVVVSPPMKVTITVDTTDGLDPTLVNFCANVTGGEPPYSYKWSSDDSFPVVCQVRCGQHAFSGVGTYSLGVEVSDSCVGPNQQVVDAAPVTITVHLAPWVRLTQPANGAVVHGIVNLASAVLVESGVTVTRVDYTVNGTYIGSATAAPWPLAWDTSGLNGTATINATAYDTKGRSNSAENTVTVTVQNPSLDGRVDVGHNPFRLRVYGLNFEHGCIVKINGVTVPYTSRKGTNLVVAKGGDSLKAMVPSGVPVIITVVNPDGGISNESTFQRY